MLLCCTSTYWQPPKLSGTDLPAKAPVANMKLMASPAVSIACERVIHITDGGGSVHMMPYCANPPPLRVMADMRQDSALAVSEKRTVECPKQIRRNCRCYTFSHCNVEAHYQTDCTLFNHNYCR